MIILPAPSYSNNLPIILIIPIYRCPVQFVEKPLCSQRYHGELLLIALVSIINCVL